MNLRARDTFGLPTATLAAGSCLLLLWLLAGRVAVSGEGGDSDRRASDLQPLIKLLADVDDPEFQRDILGGIRDGLRGRKSVAMPPSWPAVSKRLSQSESPEVRRQALALGVIFGEERAVAQLRDTMLDPDALPSERRHALETLVEQRVPRLAPLLHKLLDDERMQGPAIRGLSAYRHRQTARLILTRYPELDPDEKRDAVATLASRKADALALLDAVEKGVVPRADVSAYIARQLQQLGDERVTERLRAVWGEVRSTSKNKARRIAEYKKLLTPDALKDADAARGRLVFRQLCGKCHKLFGEGDTIGPDLTGSNRRNLDYVLENVLDPSAVIGRDYRLHKVVTADGRVLSGILVEQTDRSVTLKTENDRLVLSREDIALLQPSTVSMMPEGQLEKLTAEEIRNLLAYLAADRQVPLPP